MKSDKKSLIAYTDTPIGFLKIFFEPEKLSVIRILKEEKLKIKEIPPFAEEFIKELNLYFYGELFEFKYPFRILCKSEFQKKVLLKISEIPYGETITYKELAYELKTSPRAIGQALKRNPLPIILPCHRVLKTNGEIGGYSFGKYAKEWLINHEKTTLYKLQSHKI